MTHYAFTTSPFGNFAVAAVSPYTQRGEREAFTLTPLGDLDHVPERIVRGIGRCIDSNVIAAEGKRQREARGEGKGLLIDAPTFTVNGVDYASEVRVSRHDHGYIIVRCDQALRRDLTESAAEKIAAWWQDARALIVTPEFEAHTEAERASYELMWAERKLADAKRDYEAILKETAAARRREAAAQRVVNRIAS